MASTYGQFCPVAKAMEVLDERWTLLIVRELLCGSAHFNDLRRGVPRMSPTLLSKRLRRLERAGVLERRTEGGRTSYHLTRSGEELRPVVEALGAWGVRWVGDLGEEDLDPHLLMWDLKRTLPLERWPRERTVLAFTYTDVEPRARRWWVVVDGASVDVCDADPGYAVDATLTTTLRTMTEIWRGDRPWETALRARLVAIEAPRDVARAVPDWVGISTLGRVARPA
ncbi:helix-turn-helix domain-containing protein [Phycicoccus sp.]|uniref:winged helix-turn-helix transcriptional regulator n=1 Tax=Phycicoccus sp. TaxID=1902410 RepID=UPI002B668C61|nr:helix-turn-helix domain-containing protein [Phycicoccus sp.]HMM94285.1 helix-turn-helix domain-containing protein [Phycicoccus sp.]